MSTTNTPSAPPESVFAAELAAAKIAALRSLVETLNTTDDPVEKRRIATAILRIPDPDAAPRSKRSPRTPAPPESPLTPLARLEKAIHTVAQTDDETIRTVARQNAGRMPDLGPARFKRILAGGAPPGPSTHGRAPQACAAGP